MSVSGTAPDATCVCRLHDSQATQKFLQPVVSACNSRLGVDMGAVQRPELSCVPLSSRRAPPAEDSPSKRMRTSPPEAGEALAVPCSHCRSDSTHRCAALMRCTCTICSAQQQSRAGTSGKVMALSSDGGPDTYRCCACLSSSRRRGGCNGRAGRAQRQRVGRRWRRLVTWRLRAGMRAGELGVGGYHNRGSETM